MEITELYDLAEDFEQTAFTITDDGFADWAIEVIAEARAEVARMRKSYNEKVDLMAERLVKFEMQHNKSISFMELKLKEYVESLDLKPTKAGTRIYNLPAGKVSIKRQAPKYTVNDDEFVEWLESNGHSELVKVTKIGKWGELKKAGVIVSDDGKIVLTEQGEIVGGITAELRDDVVKVEVL